MSAPGQASMGSIGGMAQSQPMAVYEIGAVRGNASTLRRLGVDEGRSGMDFADIASVRRGYMVFSYDGPIVPVYPVYNSNTEEYTKLSETDFKLAQTDPLSTFSIDVDTASYSNIRRFLDNNQMPPEESVRIEEMINYFTYDYPNPKNDEPFSITTKVSPCPWNKDHQLALIGIHGKTLDEKEIPPSNLVFLIDVSGSMSDANKLPLLKQGFKMMVNQLTANQKVAIVAYSGAAWLVLDSTSGADKTTIFNAIDSLQSCGCTAGADGIQMGYQIAEKNFIKGGNNRIVLATDGDFNVGMFQTSGLVNMIEEKRKSGVYLTIMGFGMGNYKDEKIQQLADKGNGNAYYIDNIQEAKKVMVNELGSTLFTIAKDVKIQVEFNPAKIKEYRLVGYEKRALANKDFNDDTKDAGELGAGHTVTALYEIIPIDSKEVVASVDALKYQTTQVVSSNELMTVKLRYKKLDQDVSALITQPVTADQIEANISGDMAFASAVAEFGLLLRNSMFKGAATYDQIITLAQGSIGKDEFGYRQQFVDMVKKAKNLDTRMVEDQGKGIQFKK
ncbi:MAG: VWA domain-containing protein [Candidatus Omnitrophica bacterium]|nr:VWA domain-containing protein [Candidatus Omnitrophota bacterium]